MPICLIIRTEHGECKAFYNVCRHHAAKICDEGPGSLACARDDNGQVRVAGRFTCPYHGWQYSIDGRLARAVGMQGCENFRYVNLPLVLALLALLLYTNTIVTALVTCLSKRLC